MILRGGKNRDSCLKQASGTQGGIRSYGHVRQHCGNLVYFSKEKFWDWDLSLLEILGIPRFEI